MPARTTPVTKKIALTIAGSDPSGGAGIEVDIRVFGAFGLHALSAITLLTIQDSSGVRGILPTPPDHLYRTLTILFQDFLIEGVKIGALGTAENVEAVAEILNRFRPEKVVLDPVILSSNGFPLLDERGIEELKKRLLPEVLLVTPNMEEASILTGLTVKDQREMEEAARALERLGAKGILVKGGHLEGPPVDILHHKERTIPMVGVRIDGSFHGTGCVLSSAVTACLAKGSSLEDAIEKGRAFLKKAMEGAIKAGKGSLYLSINEGCSV